MSSLRLAFFSALILTLLWVLYPTREKTSAQAGGQVEEITFLGPDGPISGSMEEAVRVFEDESRLRHAKDPTKPIYKVVSGQNASRELNVDPTRLLLGIAGGEPPDVVWFGRYAVAEWAYRRAFLNLSEFLQKDLKENQPDRVVPEEFYPACWDEICLSDVDKGGQGVYAIPTTLYNYALIYNKDLLVKAGYVDFRGEAKPPQTWDELIEMAGVLTEKEPNGKIKRLGFTPSVNYLYLWSWANGGEFLSEDKTRCTMSLPENVEALDFLVRLYDRMGGTPNVMAFQSSFQKGELDPFVTGKVAMKIDNYGGIAYLAHYGKHVDFGVVPSPVSKSQYDKGKRGVTWVGGWCYAIPTTSKHPEAAWEFIRFMSSARAQMIIAESDRLIQESQGVVYIPKEMANQKINSMLLEKYVLHNPEMAPNVQNGLKKIMDLMEFGRYRPITPVGNFLYTQQGEAMLNGLFKKYSPRESMEIAEREVQRELDLALAPASGKPINWRWFYFAYGGVLILLVLAIYFWDVNPDFRRRASRWMFWKTSNEDAFVLEGVKRSYFRSQWWGGFICALPWIVGFVVFTGGPILFSILISFCDYDVLSPARWNGFSNYARMFHKDPLFFKSLANTFFWVMIVPIQLMVSLGMAMLLNTKIKGIALWRTMFYLPSIIPIVASSILWAWILNPQAGLLNGFLSWFGIRGPNWLLDESLSKPSLMLMHLWGAGGGMIIWLAGLKNINETYYEAADLDGASPWQKFRTITLPLLSPYIFFNLIMGLIGALQVFTPAYIMTQGGPVNSTLFYAYHLFNQTFRYLHFGYAAAMAWFLFLIVMILTCIQMKLSNRWVHYEGD